MNIAVRSTLLTLLLAAVGCAGIRLPKAVTQDGIEGKLRQRRAEAQHYFDQQHQQARQIDQSAEVAVADNAVRQAAAEGDDLAANANNADKNDEALDRAEQLLHDAQVALAEGNPAQARHCCLQAIASQPDNPQIPLSAAVDCLRANQPRLAIELLVPAAGRFPRSAAIHRALGAAYYRSGDYQSSQVALRQSLSLDNSSALSYLLMGYTLAKLGQSEAADSHIRQARRLDARYRVVR
jgi:tetratricopeptide (TPR) repeat protein